MAHSRRCYRAVADPWRLTARQVAAALGVSSAWVRHYLRASEWHHASIPDNPSRRVWFYRWSDLQHQLHADPVLAGRLARAQMHATPTMSAQNLRTWAFGRADRPLPHAVAYQSLTRCEQQDLRNLLPPVAFAWYHDQYWVLPWRGRTPLEWLWCLPFPASLSEDDSRP